MVYINVFPAQNTRLASGEEPISAGCHLSTAILQRSVAQDALLVGRPGECSNQNDEWTTREWGIQPAKITQKIAPYPKPPGKLAESNMNQTWPTMKKMLCRWENAQGGIPTWCQPNNWSSTVDPFEKKAKNQTALNRSEPRNPRYTPSLHISLWMKQTIIPVWYTNHHTHWFTYYGGMNSLLTS